MTIVELVDAHDGFAIITQKIKTQDVKTLMWLVALLTFFMSAVLDNLTTAIVMVSLLRKILVSSETRKIMVGLVVIAANAGGAWSPLGDVTTTMLWIGSKFRLWG
jgi:Na+/H+ antiporter NhaD/arsenite permease-like protein